MDRDYFKIRISGSVRVALPLSYIDAAAQIDRQLVCPVPGVAPGLLGVVNRRGNLTWVLDTSQFLELEPLPASPGRDLKALLVTREIERPGSDRRDRQTVACVVADFEGVFSPRRSRPVSQRLKPRLQPLLKHVVYDGRDGIALLDPDALLDALRQEAAAV